MVSGLYNSNAKLYTDRFAHDFKKIRAIKLFVVSVSGGRGLNMAKDEQQEAFEKSLSAILSRVIDLLKFAEAKNAALLTLSSAWVMASINLLGGTTISGELKFLFKISLPLFVIAALIAIFSFLPKINLGKALKDPARGKSLLYFGDIATFPVLAYKDFVRERYYPVNGETSTCNYLDDLSVQIAVNSRIAKTKFHLFNVGAWVFLLAFIIPAFVYLLRLCCP